MNGRSHASLLRLGSHNRGTPSLGPCKLAEVPREVEKQTKYDIDSRRTHRRWLNRFLLGIMRPAPLEVDRKWLGETELSGGCPFPPVG